jgi:quercetin dioxygenase-like cupin family protein
MGASAVRRADAPRLDTPQGVDARRLHESESVEVISIELAPGASLPRHSAPVEVFFFVVEGSGSLETGGERLEVSAGMLVPSDAGVPHTWTNGTSAPLSILVVKTPNPRSRTVRS